MTGAPSELPLFGAIPSPPPAAPEPAADTGPEIAGVALVHADPPWRELPVGAIAADLDLAWDACAPDALLLVWCPWALLPDWLAQTRDWRWGPPVTGGAWHLVGGGEAGRLWRGGAEPVLVYERGHVVARVPISAGHGSTQHSERPEHWLRQWVVAWVPEGGLVLDLYAGAEPLARACERFGRRYRASASALAATRLDRGVPRG